AAPHTPEIYTLSLHDALPIFLLGAEADYRKQILDLTEHPLLDDFADLFIRRPARVLSAVLRASPEGELDHLIAEVLRVRDAGRRSEEHTSELQSRENLVCRLL